MNAKTMSPIASLPPAGSWTEIDPAAAAPNLHRFRIIDVRQPHEYHGELGHLAGSELVPLATVPSLAATWDRRQPILVVCRSGKRAANASQFLAQNGFGAVFNLTGGMIAWNAGRR